MIRAIKLLALFVLLAIVRSVAAQPYKQCCPCLDKAKGRFVVEGTAGFPKACKLACELDHPGWSFDGSRKSWIVKRENACGMEAPAPRRPGGWEDAHEDIIIDYLTWDGTPWQASIKNGGFMHWPSGDRRFPHFDDKLNYTTWDGTHWQAKLRPNGFAHAMNGDFSRGGHFSDEIHYLTWNGSHWKAKLFLGDRFLHAPGN